MITDTRAEFRTVAEKFSAYRTQHLAPGTKEDAKAQEVEVLLSELAMLDRSIVENSNLASTNSETKMELDIQSIIEKDPHGALAKAMAARPVLRQSSTAYTTPKLFPEKVQGILNRLQTDTTSFYYKAHRVTKLLRTLPGWEKFDSKQILIVRNQLIEHTGQGSNNRELWSFGFATGVGPKLRAFAVGTEPPSHTDEGYVPNRDSFLAALSSCL